MNATETLQYARVTRNGLMELLNGLKGATFATIETATDVDLKKGHPFGAVRKHAEVNVTLNFHYGKAVNRQREREGKDADFEPKPRKWGERIPGTPLVAHNGRFYLEAKVERTLTSFYTDAHGNMIGADAIAPYLKDRGESRQGVDREVIVRDYKLDSVVSIAMNGERYIVTDFLAPRVTQATA